MKQSILIVDDDEEILNILCGLLEEKHFCRSAKTAEEATCAIEFEQYDIVITDVSMPGLNGLELLGQIKMQSPGTYVIVMSGISDEEHVKGSKEMGAYEYLAKPFNLGDVTALIERIEEDQRENEECRTSSALLVAY